MNHVNLPLNISLRFIETWNFQSNKNLGAGNKNADGDDSVDGGFC